MKILQNRFTAAVLLAAVLVLSSCASTMTIQNQYDEARDYVARRDFAGAGTIIESYKNESYKEKDRVLYYLDVGMLYHYAGEYEKSNAALSAAERGIEELYTKSLSRGGASGVLNDNALEYAGEDYEDIYLNVFKGLNYIALGDAEAALVEIRRVHIKLNLLEDKYRQQIEEYNASEEADGQIEPRNSRFHNDALARYLGLLLYRYDRSFDDARIEGDKIVQAFAEQKKLYNFARPEIPALEGEEGEAFLSLMAFSGISPRKTAKTLYLTTIPGAVIITMTDQNEDYVKEIVGFNVLAMPGVEGGFHFKFQYPQMKKMGSDVSRILLRVGNDAAEVPLLEKMENISQEIFLIKQPLIIGKAILRTVAKGILKESGKQAMKDQMSDDAGGMLLGMLLGVAADVAVDATENADLRISQYFPARAYAADLSLPPGEYPVSIEYYAGNTMLFRDDRGMMNLQPGQLNLMESFFLE